MGKRYDKPYREEVLGKVRSGMKVKDAASAYGLSEMTVRNWLRGEVSASSDVLALSRLRRENEALYRLLVRFVYESSREKKEVAVASASSNKSQAALPPCP